MHIAVLVKTVPDSEARMEISDGGRGLRVEEKWELNYFDAIAVEKAVKIKEAFPQVKVTAIAYGPRYVLEGLRKAVAMGADEAVHVEGKEGSWLYPLRAARVLSQALRDVGFHLILCGRKATDDDSGQVGPMVAEFLGIPHVSWASSLEWDGGDSLVAVRDLGDHKEKVRFSLPALVTAHKGLAEPKVPTIQGTMRGMRMQPRKLQAAEEPGTENWKLVRFAEPPRRPQVRIIEGDDPRAKARELLRILREEMSLL